MRWHFMLAAVLAILMTGGCASKTIAVEPPPAQIGTPERVRDVEQAHNYLGVQVHSFQDWLDRIPGETVNVDLLRGQWKPIPLAFDAESKAITPLSPAVAKDTKEKIALEKKVETLQDPAKTSLRGWGILAVVAGIVLVGLYFTAGFIPYVGPFIQKGGKFVLFAAIGTIAVGFTLITLARFLTQIEWIIAGTLGAAFLSAIGIGAYYLYLHHKDYLLPWPTVTPTPQSIPPGAT